MSTTTAMTAIQRPMRGSRVSSFYPVKSLPSLASLESAFQIQEYISLLIRHDVHDVDRIVALPERHNVDEKTIDLEDGKGDDKDGDRKSELAVDRACWIYEHLRRLAQDLTHPLITMLQQECTRASCREMKAGEWLYLCVAHGNDGAMEQCCAIDYILHTLDSATALLNSPRAFPSRLSIPQTSYRHFSSLARRLGRIFAHAYFHHREAFEQAEAESSLYARFLKLTSQFDLVPAEFLVIPESALSPDPSGHGKGEDVEPPRLAGASIPHDEPSEDGHGHGEHEGLHQHEEGGEHHHPASVLAPKSPASRYEKAGTDSPRRVGRSRTDTMIYSDGYAVAEELARGSASPASGGSALLDRSPSQAPAVSLPPSSASAAARVQPEDGSWREGASPEDMSALDVPGDADEYGDDLDDESEGDGLVDEVDEAGPGSNSPPLEELPAMTLAGAEPSSSTEVEEKAEDAQSEPPPPPAGDLSAETPSEPSYTEAAAVESPVVEEPPAESIDETDAEQPSDLLEEAAPAEETPAPAPIPDDEDVPMEEGDIAPSPAKEKAHTEALESSVPPASGGSEHPQESDITDEGVHAHDEEHKAEEQEQEQEQEQDQEVAQELEEKKDE